MPARPVFRPLTPPLNVVLVAPEIPPNTGNIARLCACTGSRLHLVAPLGFGLSDRDLRRAGLDYWADVHVRTWASFDELADDAALGTSARGTLHLFSADGARTYVETSFQPGDWLVYGRESRGLPRELLERFADRTVAVPMLDGRRSLNLASTASLTVYEALRQCGALGAQR